MKRIRKLRTSKHRRAESAFFVEGIGPVWQAVDGRADIEALVVAPDLLTSDRARAMVEEQAAAGTEVVRVGPAAFASIAERDNPTGLAAVVRIRRRSLADLEAAGDSIFVALVDVGSPGNLGSIIRTVDAVGGAGVVCVGESTDPWHPEAVKASMGTLFSVPVAFASDAAEVFDWCRSNGVAAVTTSAHAELSYRDAGIKPPLALVLGSEAHGLPEDVLSAGDVAVRIPMAGTATSLNLAVAAGVLLYALTDD